jgi:hypothetical protein
VRRYADTIFDSLAALVLLAFGVVVLLTYQDYGVTWDESWHLAYGEHIRQFYLTRGEDLTALRHKDFMYGGGFDLLGAVAVANAGIDRYEVIHLVGAGVGMLGLVGAWRLGRGLAGPLGGLCSLVMLAVTPVYYGHSFNNPKDLPFAVGYVWALVYLVEVIKTAPAVSRATWVKLTIVCGGAMCVRVGGVLALCYLAMIVVGYAAARAVKERSLRFGYAYLEQMGARAFAVALGAWAIMVSAWPWSQVDPFRRPYLALSGMTQFKQHVRKVPVAGEWIYSYEVEWDYLPRYFAFKLPELLWGLVALGVIGALVGFAWRARNGKRLRKDAVHLFLVFVVLFPPAYAVHKESALYDGLRHFLFLVPVLAVVAGVTAARTMQWLARRNFGLGATVGAIALAATIELIHTMAVLHPHQYVFFNRGVGGLPGAFMNYSSDYYGNSYKEAFEELDRYTWQLDPHKYMRARFIVAGCIPWRAAQEYFKPQWRWRRGKGKSPAQFYVAYTRNKCHKRFPNAPVIADVTRFGTTLTVIRDLRTRPQRTPQEQERDITQPPEPDLEDFEETDADEPLEEADDDAIR